MTEYYFYNEITEYDNEYYEIIENKISELSLHLQTYLNYREASILVICGEIRPSFNTSQMKYITNWEEEMILHYYNYSNYLDKNTQNTDDLKFKFHTLKQILKSSPNNPEAKYFKNFLKSKTKLWESLHILSKLEIHLRPQLLKKAINILTRLSNDESKLNQNTPFFFHFLHQNYQQLDHEYNQLLFIKENGYHKSENELDKVMIRE